MSDIFDDTLAAAAESFFLLPGAEMIDYISAGGAVKQIRAVVFRNPAEQLAGVAGGSLPELAVLVRNDSAGGIASGSVDTGGDKIAAAKKTGDPPVRMRITEVLNQDAGLMLLAVK